MFKKNWFWVSFFILSILAIFYTINYFPKVMSFINIDITMNKDEAFEQTTILAEKNGWGTEDFRQVAIFNSDGSQTYVELEGGGKEAFNQLLQSDFFSYYFWVVRNYKPGQLLDSFTTFQPTGEPYGFEVRYPEDMELPNLAQDQALQMAKQDAETNWDIDFTNYKLNDKKLVTTPKGRKDHTFIFERTDQQIKDAKFRLKIIVKGDKFAELSQELKVPEAFSRRYQEMRSANNTIAGIGSVLMIILYGVLGIVMGAFFLLKSKWLLWKKALFWAIFIASIEFIASFNNLSLSWIYYQTTSSPSEHILSFFASSFSGFISNIFLLGFSFMVGESLTRKAFGNHTQLWSNWSAGTANSKKIMGNTIGAYLWVPISISYILVFYTITTNYFGWWNSSSLNIDPNTLATPFPWLGAISMALHAGFWEECLFRAVPIAGAILIGRRFNKEKLFFWIGIILQIVIFGMGHANYAAQPSYARVIELIFPSIMFAIAYIRFGLLTGVLIHFLFDAVLMAMPIWMVKPSEMMGNKILFIISILIPILVLIYRKFRAKDEADITKTLNSAWKPQIAPEQEVESTNLSDKTVKTLNKKIILVLGIIGLIVSGLFFYKTIDAKKLEITKADAIRTSTEYLESIGEQNIDDFEVIVDTQTSGKIFNRIYWKDFGKEKFNLMADDFYSCNTVKVRFAKFKGDLQERAEEYSFGIAKDGKILKYSHFMHEETAGATLDESAALQTAQEKLIDIFDINLNDLTLINAIPDSKDNRLDWGYTWKDTVNFVLGENEVRYTVRLAGNKLSSYHKHIEIPEKVTRKFFSDMKLNQSIGQLVNVVSLLIYISAFVLLIIAWSKKRFNLKLFTKVFTVAFIINLLGFILTLPTLKMGFSTSEPYANQMIMKAAMGVLLGLGGAFYLGMLFAYFSSNFNSNEKLSTGIWIGAIGSGIFFLILGLLPQLTPNYPMSKALTNSVPFLGAIVIGLKALIKTLFMLLSVYIVFEKISLGFQKRNWLVIIAIFLLSLSITMRTTFVNMDNIEIITWIITSIFTTTIAYLMIKKMVTVHDNAIIWFAGIYVAFNTLGMAMANAYPGAMVHNIVSALVILAATYLLDKLSAK